MFVCFVDPIVRCGGLIISFHIYACLHHVFFFTFYVSALWFLFLCLR